MKPLHIALLVAAGALGGSVVMRMLQRPAPVVEPTVAQSAPLASEPRPAQPESAPPVTTAPQSTVPAVTAPAPRAKAEIIAAAPIVTHVTRSKPQTVVHHVPPAPQSKP